MRLQSERLPNARDRGLGQASDIGQAARGPLRGLSRRPFERASNDVDNAIVRRFARRTRPWLISQPWQTTDAKPLAPFADAVARHAESLCDRPIGEAVGTRQHHARPQRHALRRGRPARPLLQRTAFVFSQHDRFVVAGSRHAAQRTCAPAEVQHFF
jgi:hypothetical protein